MRNVGVGDVLLGLAALGLIASESIRATDAATMGHGAELHAVVASQRLIGWAAFVGCVALATLARGIGELVMAHRARTSADAPTMTDGETAGREIPPHRVPGEITVHCIEGHVAFEHDAQAIELHAGDLMHLCPQEIHAIKGIADSSVLVTRLRPHADEPPEKFPAP